MSHRNLVVAQPYTPGYRVPFFDALVERLAAEGIRCQVVTPGAQGEPRARGDCAAAGSLWEAWARTRGLPGLGQRAAWLATEGEWSGGPTV